MERVKFTGFSIMHQDEYIGNLCTQSYTHTLVLFNTSVRKTVGIHIMTLFLSHIRMKHLKLSDTLYNVFSIYNYVSLHCKFNNLYNFYDFLIHFFQNFN